MSNTVLQLTPPGVGAIAVVRICGPRVPLFLQQHFSRPTKIGAPHHGELRDGDRVIDDPVIVLIDDQSADINLHGGQWVVRAAIELAERNGFTHIPATAPLPHAAVDAESELEREVLASFPLAKTREALKVLLSQIDLWGKLKQNPTHEALQQALVDRTLHWHLHTPRVAIVGPANAGKSTLANQLFGQQRSITADVPGTTRDWVGEIANIHGLAVTLMDTPGIRASQDAIETQAIARASGVIDQADLVLLVLDATRPQECELVERFPDAIRIMNKTDKAPSWDPSAHSIVATTGLGIDALRANIRVHFGTFTGPQCWTNRQRAIVQRAIHTPAALDSL